MMRVPMTAHGQERTLALSHAGSRADHRNAPVNALGYLREMFAVDDLDGTLPGSASTARSSIDEVVQYEDVYRLCYVRGPEGILIGLAEQLG